MTRKILSLLVAALMVLAIVPFGSAAKGQHENEILNYNMTRLQLGEEIGMDRAKNSESVAARELINDGSVLDFDFETAYTSEGWWVVNKDSDTSQYTNWLQFQSGDYAHSGSVFMGSYSTSQAVSGTVDNWLITPEIAIPASGYTLTFWAASTSSSSLDKLQVLIAKSTDNAYNISAGTITTSRWATLQASADVPAEWTCYDIDLSDYAGSTVCIAFRHRMTSNKYLLRLDDVAVGQMVEATPETSITLDQATLDLVVTGTAQLTATIAPENATYTDVTWTSSDTSVAAVNMAGGVMGLAPGTAVITATSHNGLTATCTVTVTQGENAFDDTMQAFAVADYDAEAYVETWYGIDQYGTLTEDVVDGQHYILRSEFCGMDGLVYAYVANLTTTSSGTSIESVDFVTFDPADDYAMTMIKEGVAAYPDWMAYDYETGIMYGGYLYQDDLSAYHDDIRVIDLTDGTFDEYVIDLYNETYDIDGTTYTLHFAPQYATSLGNGWFLGVDEVYECFIVYILDYQGQGFDFMFLGDYDIPDMVGEITSYQQKIWYNPFDGMVYWAADFNIVNYVVLDLSTGIAVSTGTVGQAGAYYGCGVTALYTYYLYDPTAVETYTVTYTINGEEYAVQEYEAGETITPPEYTVPEGYTFSGWTVPETMPEEDITVDATLTINTYTLTINYVDADGNKLAASVVVTYDYGTEYSVASPEIPGYTPNIAVVSGTMTGDLEVTVVYTADEPPVTVNPGDVDCNGLVNMADLALAASYVQNSGTVTEQGILNGDMNGDGAITAADLAALYQLILG